MIAAFFDIDGTIYRDSLLMEHFKKLIKYELIDINEYESKVKKDFKNWDERKGGYDNYLLGLAETYFEAIKEVSISDNDFAADQVMKLKADRVYTYTREMIKWHNEQGHKVIFISGSPDFLVSRMAKKWGAIDFCGTKYHVEGDRFTGEVTPMWDSESKMTAVNKFIQKYDLDLSKSYAYGDTMGDLTMLRLVGNPVAINPSHELLTTIQGDESLQNVSVVVERKDIVYKLRPDVKYVKCLKEDLLK